MAYSACPLSIYCGRRMLGLQAQIRRWDEACAWLNGVPVGPLQRRLSSVEPEITRQIYAYSILKCSRWLQGRVSPWKGHYRPARTYRYSASASWRVAPGWNSVPDGEYSGT
jgi:hypothetical protein